jgi:hypothetical protein
VPIFKTLHILSMIAMVTIEIGSEFLYAFAISRRDVPALAAVHRLQHRAQDRAADGGCGSEPPGPRFRIPCRSRFLRLMPLVVAESGIDVPSSMRKGE